MSRPSMPRAHRKVQDETAYGASQYSKRPPRLHMEAHCEILACILACTRDAP